MRVLWLLLKHFGAGTALILMAAAVLLFTDPKWNAAPKEQQARRKIAVVNFVSATVLEDGQKGMMAGLAEAGFVDGENIDVTFFNAEGDRATGIMLAKEVTSGEFDLILSLSTPMLQAVAGANVTQQKTHVFTLSTDPWGAGVGINPKNPAEHPPYMTGHGTLQPVAKVFALARQANPKLKKVGVVWNPAESNSETSTLMAREVCKQLNMELVEMTIDSSSGVLEATKALLGRQVEAIWVGGDATVAPALDTLIATARDGRIPVFTNMPSDVKQGAIFALGADYFEVGRNSGLLAARVLEGESPAGIPVENFVPEQLALNTLALLPFQETWKFPPDWRGRAKVLVDEQGVHEERKASAAALKRPARGRRYHVSILYFGPNPISSSSISGLKKKLTERGFVEGENITYREEHAQGDLAMIPPILQQFDQSETDLIVTLSTPCLTAAAAGVKQKPVVFTEVYDPLAAGAGTSATKHLPHVTGVGSFPPLDEMLETMEMLVPNLRSVGLVYNNSEANSRKTVEVARQLCAARGLKLEEATVNNTSEILQSTQALIERDVQVLWEVGDNTVLQGLEALLKVGFDAGIPVINSDADSVDRGALAGVGIRFQDSGYAAGELVARVLLGESPEKMPFEELSVVRRGFNFAAAKRLNRTVPEAFLKQCHVFHHLAELRDRPAKVAFVQLVEGPALDEATRGVFAGLEAAGLVADRDYTVKKYNAQGDLAQLPQIFEAAKAESPDVIITSTTPAMIAGARSTPSIPLVFTVASEPSAVGVVPPGERQANVTGVYDDPPIAQLLELAKRQEGRLTTIGTIWNPAEPNSEISVKRLREACRVKGYQLIERNAASVSEVREVAAAITQSGIDVLVISADNVTSSGFPAIYSVLQPAGIPIYCTEPDLVSQGAAGALGVDFADWGQQSAVLAARVLAGVKPLSLPLEKVDSIHTRTRPDADR